MLFILFLKKRSSLVMIGILLGMMMSCAMDEKKDNAVSERISKLLHMYRWRSFFCRGVSARKEMQICYKKIFD